MVYWPAVLQYKHIFYEDFGMVLIYYCCNNLPNEELSKTGKLIINYYAIIIIPKTHLAGLVIDILPGNENKNNIIKKPLKYNVYNVYKDKIIKENY